MPTNLTPLGLLAAMSLALTMAFAAEPVPGPKPTAAVVAGGPIFYVDPKSGDDNNDGTAPEKAWKTTGPFDKHPAAGATVLFKRGSVIRGGLNVRGGKKEGPVTYSAYGEGERPIFLRSHDISNPSLWKDQGGNVWKCEAPGWNTANLVYNHGAACGNKRWLPADLKTQGEWYFPPVKPPHGRNYYPAGTAFGKRELFLYSIKNPGEFYESIEWVPGGNAGEAPNRGNHLDLFGRHHDYVVLDGLSFRNAGVHGIWLTQGVHHVVIRNCELAFIGGSVYRDTDPAALKPGDRNTQRCRFGNAIETWGGAHDITIVGCLIRDIFDGAICLQGGERDHKGSKNWIVRDNVIVNAGFDGLDIFWNHKAENILFENNTCVNGGEGWALQGLPRPRESEFLPDNIGPHVYIGDTPCENTVTIRNNIFCNAPESRCVYFPVFPKTTTRFVIDHNCHFQADNGIIVQAGQTPYRAADFKSWQEKSGFDAHSLVRDPGFRDPAAWDFRLRPDSPCVRAGAAVEEIKDFTGTLVGKASSKTPPSIGAYQPE